jgi:hypothetical protein
LLGSLQLSSIPESLLAPEEQHVYSCSYFSLSLRRSDM